jgi:glycosyltransferase involved in cell wall biosynthesis
MTVELSVVVPVYDEAAVIREVITELAETAGHLVPPGRWEIVAVDDASTDDTPGILDELAGALPGVRVVHLERNGGHGPALRVGWEHASGDWVGHLDGDGEVPAAALVELWERRSGADLVLGVRTDRTNVRSRRFVSASLRWVTRVVTGRWLADVNTPCKLVRRRWLERSLPLMPPRAFAPSVLLVVAVARLGGRIVETSVDVSVREGDRSWLVPRRLAVGCARSLVETVGVWRQTARRSRAPVSLEG